MKTEHPIQWVTASPLWDEAAQDAARMQRPALLRFGSDSFMEDLTALVQTNPRAMANQLATPRTYRGGPVGDANGGEPLPEGSPLKLYQPIHGHFNLVAANLVCRIAGLPDRTVNSAQNEAVSFVLRQLGPNGGESAWVVGPPGDKGWRSLGDNPRQVLVGEELLPLFPVNYAEDARTRRLHVGLIPTASREVYRSAAQLAPAGSEGDPRLEEVNGRVIDTLKALVNLTQAPSLPAGLSQAKKDEIRAAAAENEAEASRFLLLDLAEFLDKTLPGLWQAVYNGTPLPATDPGADLYNLLAGKTVDGTTTWQAALKSAYDERSFITGESPGTPSLNSSLKNTDLKPADLHDALKQALGPPPADLPLPVVPPVPKIDPKVEALYVLRCVYQRPRCGVLHADVVSPPSEAFALAPFFDFDAPSRPVRIALPVDTSIAGLRKFSKNVGFLVSDKLRSQIKSVADLKAVLDGNLASGESFNLGELCSFSIPIITICALVVLLIFILLLNIVFWWLPFFRICLPIPLKAR